MSQVITGETKDGFWTRCMIFLAVWVIGKSIMAAPSDPMSMLGHLGKKTEGGLSGKVKEGVKGGREERMIRSGLVGIGVMARPETGY